MKGLPLAALQEVKMTVTGAIGWAFCGCPSFPISGESDGFTKPDPLPPKYGTQVWNSRDITVI